MGVHQRFFVSVHTSFAGDSTLVGQSGYPEALPTKAAISAGMRQLVAAALAPRIPEDGSVAAFKVHDAVADYAVPKEEKQALHKRLWAQSYAPLCEKDPAAKRHVMEVMQDIWAELEDGTKCWETHPGINRVKQLLRGLDGSGPRISALQMLFRGAILTSLSPSAAKALNDADVGFALLDGHVNAHRHLPTLQWATVDWRQLGIVPWVPSFDDKVVARVLLPEEDVVRRVFDHADQNAWWRSYLKVKGPGNMSAEARRAPCHDESMYVLRCVWRLA